MRIGQLTDIAARWIQYESDVYGTVPLKITPKTAKLEKEIGRRSVTTKMGRKGKMTVETNAKLALKLLIGGCLHGMGNAEFPLENNDGTPWEFTKEAALDLLWNGPADLVEFFEAGVETASEDADEGNAGASDD